MRVQRTNNKPQHAGVVALAHVGAECADQLMSGKHHGTACDEEDAQDAGDCPSVGHIVVKNQVERIEGMRRQGILDCVHDDGT